MSPDIIAVLAILIGVLILLITEWAPLETLAMLVMGMLAITGIVSPKEALAGFSSPAVITIWAVFILSGGLTRTGIANILGRQLLKVAGGGESILVIIIMTIAGVLSAFMNNVAVAALMLPVVMDIARKTHRSPSTLLMPLAYGSLLGGLTTMIGTPPNILVSDALFENGLKPFGLFDFSPTGLFVMFGGIAFVTFVGIRFLPKRNPAKEAAEGRQDFRSHYRLKEQLFRIHIPKGSALVGKTLADSRLGAALGVNVVGITRKDETLLAPASAETLRADDDLVVQGNMDQIREMNHWGQLLTEAETIDPDELSARGMGFGRLALHPGDGHSGRSLAELGFRNRFGLNVLAIERGERLLDTDLRNQSLLAGDILLVYGSQKKIAAAGEDDRFTLLETIDRKDQPLADKLAHDFRRLRVPDGSKLVGRTLTESRLGDATNIQILCIIRKDGTTLVPTSDERFAPADRLIVWGKANMISVLLMQGLEGILVEETTDTTDPAMLEDDQVGLVEVMLSPHSTLSGMRLRELNFREKYGLTVLAIWRKGRAYKEDLREMAITFGDALLLHGPRQKLHLLGSEPDFLVLTETVQQMPREEKAKIALGIMAAVLLPVIMGWVPIYIAVVIGAAFMVISGCLTMDEAYRYIEWKAVFLIAGMLPLGTALEKTGAARLLAEGVIGSLGPFGPHAVLFGLLSITFAATSIIPTSALVVLMVPIALESASGLGISPYALMMGIAMAASSSFTSPISHPANVLVMGPGGYRFIDYVKVGAPLTMVVMIILMVVLPIFWPL